ncbi:sugar ABC transporter substrate-binding protein [Streptacidiphilus sp. N1-12]|uniref:Sugar ABC transporter substrate-binding protein n=2 Tax=Streptacidiphilus alkalitolerans TaxID=3342712 RepID=A0ABV6VM75_9ACTN
MRSRALLPVTVCAAFVMAVSACASSKTVSGGSPASSGAKAVSKGKIGVILPDTKSSARWANDDAPLLTAAFKQAGVSYDIQNAQGDATQMQTIADQMITSGVTVLVITNLDSGSGKAIETKAAANGVATIDYDRLTLGGSAQYYVSFDNVAVGKLQGQGLVNCLQAQGAKKPVVAELNGSPTDNNATLFAQGYNSVLDPLYANGTLVKGPNQSVPNWDNQQAGTIFEQMLTAQPNIGGVLSANDGLGGAVIAILSKNHRNGKVPVTGQDATVSGLQDILAGDQCMTVYKAVKKEASAAAELAVALDKGQKPAAPNQTYDPVGKRQVPSVLLTPEAITKSNIKEVIGDGYVTRAQLCTGAYAALCTAAGL